MFDFSSPLLICALLDSLMLSVRVGELCMSVRWGMWVKKPDIEVGLFFRRYLPRNRLQLCLGVPHLDGWRKHWPGLHLTQVVVQALYIRHGKLL